MEQQGFLFWPHGLPLLDAASDFEFGFSFEAANPQISDFVTVLFDAAWKYASIPDGSYLHYCDRN